MQDMHVNTSVMQPLYNMCTDATRVCITACIMVLYRCVYCAYNAWDTPTLNNTFVIFDVSVICNVNNIIVIKYTAHL